MPDALPNSFFDRPAPDVAAALVGVMLLVEGVGGVVVETEAYTRDDPASHSFVGRTTRNAAMFGPAGSAYVYRSYGIHWCFNVVCGGAGAVLIRALEPLAGIAVMQERRRTTDVRLLCRGPGRLCQALALSGAMDGRRLDAPPFALTEAGAPAAVAAGRRIGISKAAEIPWRFMLAGSRFISRPA